MGTTTSTLRPKMASASNEAIGKRLLPSLVDEIAASDPDRILFSVTKTKNPEDGFEDITAKTFARAVDRCSRHIEKTLGRGRNFPTLTYMGPQDIVYAVVVLACIKTGYKLLLNSPRNSLETHLSLFEKTNCTVFLLPPNFPLPIIQQILDSRPMRTVEIPKIWHWLEDVPVKPYPFTKTFAKSKYEPFVVLHTSGSTSMSKPVTLTHATFTPLDAGRNLPSHGYKPVFPALCAGTRLYVGFPLFHCAGISMLLPASIYCGYTAVLGPFPPTAEIANAVHVRGNVQQSCLPPTVLVDLANDDTYLNNLTRLELISFAGGPCPRETGDRINSKTHLFTCVGTTEGGYLPSELCDPEDWGYSRFSPALGHQYRHVSGDLYEQVIVKRPEYQPYQGIFGTFPDLTEWPMKDLYSKHPTKDDLWLYRGRADDIIVLSTGEKFNPVDIENMISSNPAVIAAIVSGFGRFQPALLVEAFESPRNVLQIEQAINSIWPSVQAANKMSAKYAQIHRDMIIFTSPEKPMPRAGKGTVQRKLTVDQYATEFDALYQSRKQISPLFKNNETGINDETDKKNIEDSVRQIITQCMDVDACRLTPDADLFELGLDSLQVTFISRRINELLVTAEMKPLMQPKIVYSNPSISSLSATLTELVKGQKVVLESGGNDEKTMKELYEAHATNMLYNARSTEAMPSGNQTVLLTGSTGSLGSYILDSLSANPTISRIYCLNRGPASMERQRKSLSEKGLCPLDTKVICLDAKLSQPYFGLSKEEYRILLNEVTLVIHNAWKVDFNLSVRSFSNHIAIVRRIIDFSILSRFSARIFFISTPGAIGGRIEPNGTMEKVYDGWDTPQTTGYGQSKFIAELLLDKAAKEAEIPVAICRLGQVSGPMSTAGMWPKQEWFPSLVASSKYLRKIPNSLGKMNNVNWVPVDSAGQIIAELATSPLETNNGATVLHISNPQDTSWAKLVPCVQQSLGSEILELVSLDEWVRTLREDVDSSQDINNNPAAKLLDFYADLATDDRKVGSLDTTKSVGLSKTLANLDPIQEACVMNWMKQWAF